MSSKITIDLDNNTGPGMDQIRKDLARLGIEGDKTEAALSALNSELSSREATDQAAKIKKLADEYDRMNGIVRQGGGAGGGAGSMGMVNLAAKANLAMMAIKGVAQGAKMAYEVIAKMADTSPQFAKLKTAWDEMSSSSMELFSAFASSDFGKHAMNLTTIAMKEVSTSFKESDTSMMDMTLGAVGTFALIQEGMGGNAEAASNYMETLREMKAEFLAVKEAERKAFAIEQSGKMIEQSNAAIKKATDAAAAQRAVAAMTDRNAVLLAIGAENAALQALADTGVILTKEQVAESAAKVMALKAQERKIQDDEVARLKAGDEAALKQREANDKAILDAEQKTIDDITEMERQAQEDRWKDAMNRIDMRQDAEKKAAAERVAIAEQEAKAKAEAQTKRAESLKGNVGQLVGGLDPRKVAQQVGKQRGQDAFNQFGRKNAGRYAQAQRTGDRGTMRSLMRQQKQAATNARQQGFRDVRRGKASGDEVIQAQQGLAGDVINNAEATGKVNAAQAGALREASNTMAEQQRQLNQLEQDIRQTGATMRGLTGRGGNSTGRAQRAGG